MTVETLCNYLNKNKYNYNLKLYGDTGYFKNAPGYTYHAIEISLENDDINALRNELLSIEKYAKRYNLDIFHRSNFRFNYVTNKYNYFLVIRTAENKAAAENYYFYRDQSINECENLIHEYHVKGIYYSMHKMLNYKLEKIIDKYGDQYNDSLLKIAI